MIISSKQLLVKYSILHTQQLLWKEGIFLAIRVQKYMLEMILFQDSYKLRSTEGLKYQYLKQETCFCHIRVQVKFMSRAIIELLLSDARLLLALFCYTCPHSQVILFSKKASLAPTIISELQPSSSRKASYLLHKTLNGSCCIDRFQLSHWPKFGQLYILSVGK